MSRLHAVLALGLAAGATALVLGGDHDDRQLVHAEFRDAAGLRPGSAVRVSGATVGTVRDLHVTGHDTAEATLEVDPDAAPGVGARASIRALNLLGEKFVDLAPGDRSRPLISKRIGLTRTSAPVEIDDVLDVLDPSTRDRLGLLLAETGVALGHRGRDLSAALKRLPPTLDDARELLAQLGSDTAVLDRLLVEADRVSTSVAAERRPLGRLTRTGAGALAAPAARAAGLEATLRRTPAALAQLRTTLGRLDRAGGALRPAARGLRAMAPSLTGTLRALPGFEAAAAPALNTLREVSPSLTRLGRRAAPVVRRLRTTGASLRSLAADAEPLTRTLDRGAAADLISVMQNWALAIQGRDGVGHLFRVSLSLTPDLVRHLDAYVQGPPRRRRGGHKPSMRPKVTPKVVDPVTKVADRVKPTAEGVKQAVDGVLESAPKRDEKAKPLLDFLLGP